MDGVEEDLSDMNTRLASEDPRSTGLEGGYAGGEGPYRTVAPY
jgi:hypothetical protein